MNNFYPQPFEVALVRKIKARTTTIHDAFLLLDVDGDGRVSSSDIRTVLHNELNIDVTKEQEDYIFSHPSLMNDSEGMNYGEFAKYFSEVSKTAVSSSEAGYAAAAGFQKDNTDSIDIESPIHLHPATLRLKLRHQLRQLLTAHSTHSPAKTGSAMKETSLFLAIDVHRSGKVTMVELLGWLNEVGNMEWTIEDLELVVLGTPNTAKDENNWFSFTTNDDSNNSLEAGMTENEFAKFVESLNMDYDGRSNSLSQ